MVGDAVGTHRQEGVGTNVQRHRHDLDAARPDGIEKGRGEVQAGDRLGAFHGVGLDRAGGRLWAALLATTLLNLPLGSVYSFSVLLRPLEQELGVTRSALSLVFGLATAGFTVGSVLVRWGI